jgi:hypothetical protein
MTIWTRGEMKQRGVLVLRRKNFSRLVFEFMSRPEFFVPHFVDVACQCILMKCILTVY